MSLIEVSEIVRFILSSGRVSRKINLSENNEIKLINTYFWLINNSQILKANISPDLRSSHISRTNDSKPMDIKCIIDVGVGGDTESAMTDDPKKRSDIRSNFSMTIRNVHMSESKITSLFDKNHR